MLVVVARLRSGATFAAAAASLWWWWLFVGGRRRRRRSRSRRSGGPGQGEGGRPVVVVWVRPFARSFERGSLGGSFPFSGPAWGPRSSRPGFLFRMGPSRPACLSLPWRCAVRTPRLLLVRTFRAPPHRTDRRRPTQHLLLPFLFPSSCLLCCCGGRPLLLAVAGQPEDFLSSFFPHFLSFLAFFSSVRYWWFLR